MARFPTGLIFLFALPLLAQQPVPLRDGQQIALQGILAMEPAGRLQFAAIRTREAYVPMVMGDDHKQHQAEPVHEIGLSGYNRYDLLYGHRGHAVTVVGKVMTDSTSPYYFHSTSLQVSSIRLADGAELLGSPRTKQRLAVDVGEYRASVVLPADAAQPWQYTANGKPDVERRFLSCSSNGGGDVVNCSCAEGFRPVHAESSIRGMDVRILNGSGPAQFGPVDSAHRIELLVSCSR